MKKLIIAPLAFAASIAASNAVVIISDDINATGDAVADIAGTITTPWAGFNFAGTVANNYFGLLAISNGAAATGDPLLDLDNDVPGISQAGGQAASVTYAGTIAEGTYTLRIQIPDYENDPAPASIAYTFGGLAPTTASGTALVAGDDVIETLTFVVGAGDAAIGNNLDFTIATTGPGGNYNVGFDHLEVDYVPEPSTALLAGLGILGLVRRRR